LIVHSQFGSHREEFTGKFAEFGIASDRIEFVPIQPWQEHMRTFDRIDIALDPFPCSGGISTCDALWMGAAVVTLKEKLSIGRSGASILSAIGLPELIAKDSDEYVALAVDLANDSNRLSILRAGMRHRMLESPLMDAPKFARNFESTLRRAWERWCR
jgi:protein O-GlcNAc transferase